MHQLQILHRVPAAIGCPSVRPLIRPNRSAMLSFHPCQTLRCSDHILCSLPSSGLGLHLLGVSRMCWGRLQKVRRARTWIIFKAHTTQLASLLRGWDVFGLSRFISGGRCQHRSVNRAMWRIRCVLSPRNSVHQLVFVLFVVHLKGLEAVVPVTSQDVFDALGDGMKQFHLFIRRHMLLAHCTVLLSAVC